MGAKQKLISHDNIWNCAARSGLMAMVARDSVPGGQWVPCSSILFGWSGTSDRSMVSVLKNTDWDTAVAHLIESRRLSLKSQSKGQSLMFTNSLGKKAQFKFYVDESVCHITPRGITPVSVRSWFESVRMFLTLYLKRVCLWSDPVTVTLICMAKQSYSFLKNVCVNQTN